MESIRLGYACINTQLKEFDIFTSRTLILKTAASQGLDYVKKLASNNVDDLLKIIIFNEAHGIRFFRISSGLFPHLGNPKLGIDANYDLSFIKDKLKVIGSYAKRHGHRLTMHPGQFVQLGSPKPEVVQQSLIDLKNHAEIFRLMNYKPEDGAVLVIHGGGTFGNKTETLQRWKNNYLKLPDHVRNYVVLENDEISYSIMDLLPLCEELNMPFCLDVFHNKISRDWVPITRKLLRRILNTWKRRHIVPKIHVSEQQPGLRRGAHSFTLDRLPLYLFLVPKQFKTSLDIMLEVKDKEVSVFKMYHKYFDIKMDSTGRVIYQLKNNVMTKIQKIFSIK